MNHQQVAHEWWKGKKRQGKGCNMFFEDRTIYSYGRHFPIAHYIDVPGFGRACFFTSRDYSISTAKHKRHAARAIDKYACEEITVHLDTSCIGVLEYAVKNKAFTENARALFEAWSEELGARAAANIEAASRARKYGAMQLEAAKANADEWQALARFVRLAFEDVCLVPPAAILQARDISEDMLAEIRRKAKEKEAEYRRRELERRAEEIEAWKQGLSAWCPSLPGRHYLLRVKENHVETSGGVKIPVSLAKRLLPLALKSFDGQADADAFKAAGFSDIGGFPVHNVNADLWQIGCHTIPTSELRRVAEQIQGI